MNIVLLVLTFLIASAAIFVFLFKKKAVISSPAKNSLGSSQSFLKQLWNCHITDWLQLWGQKSLKSCTQKNPRAQAQELTSGISSVMMSTWWAGAMSSSLSVCRELWRWCFPLFSFFCFFFFLSFSSFCLCLLSSSSFTYWSDMGIPGGRPSCFQVQSTRTEHWNTMTGVCPAPASTTQSQPDPHLCASTSPHTATQTPALLSIPSLQKQDRAQPCSLIPGCITASQGALRF